MADNDLQTQLKGIVDAGLAAGKSRTQIQSELDAARAKAKTPPPAAKSPDSGDSLLMSAVKAAPGVIADVGMGLAKGAGDMVVGAGQMVDKIPGVTALVDKMYQTPGISDNAMKVAHQELQASNPSQSVGKGIADVAAFAAPELVPSLMPAGVANAGGSIMAALGKAAPYVKAALSNAAITGTQTGGNPEAMATSGALGVAGEGLGQGLQKLAGGIREGQAAPVAARRTAALAKKAGDTMDDPQWMDALATNKEQFTNLIKEYGLTGGKGDLDIIKSAPANKQTVLSALSRQLDPSKKSFGHIWSLLAGAEGLGGAMTGHGLEGLGIAAPLAGMGVANKYPGATAKTLDALSPYIKRLIGMGGGASVAGVTPDNGQP